MSDIREPDIALELEEIRQSNRIAVIRLSEVRQRAREREAKRDGDPDLPVFPTEPAA